MRDVTEQLLDVVVAGITPVTPGTVKLTLTTHGADMPEWAPGAHIDLHLETAAGPLVRQYSLCGRPENRTRYEVAVARAESGRGGSDHVHRTLRPGDRLRIGGPRNHFPFVLGASHLFIAGGIGITPLLPMIRAAAAAGADWKLLFCGKTRATMPFADELREIGGDRVQLHESSVQGRADLGARMRTTGPGMQIHCCGPEAMIAEVEAIGATLTGDRVHVERFAPRAEAPGAEDSFEVEFASTGEVVTIAPGQSILEVAEGLGLEVDSSCQEGTCGSCETKVISGQPIHRCSVLTAKERLANKSMMICVSRGAGRLVLDV